MKAVFLLGVSFFASLVSCAQLEALDSLVLECNRRFNCTDTVCKNVVFNRRKILKEQEFYSEFAKVCRPGTTIRKVDAFFRHKQDAGREKDRYVDSTYTFVEYFYLGPYTNMTAYLQFSGSILRKQGIRMKSAYEMFCSCNVYRSANQVDLEYFKTYIVPTLASFKLTDICWGVLLGEYSDVSSRYYELRRKAGLKKGGR